MRILTRSISRSDKSPEIQSISAEKMKQIGESDKNERGKWELLDTTVYNNVNV